MFLTLKLSWKLLILFSIPYGHLIFQQNILCIYYIYYIYITLHINSSSFNLIMPMYFPQIPPGYRRPMCNVPSSTMRAVPLEYLFSWGTLSSVRWWGPGVPWWWKHFPPSFMFMVHPNYLEALHCILQRHKFNIKAAKWDYWEAALFLALVLHGSFLIPPGPVGLRMGATLALEVQLGKMCSFSPGWL